jgi:phytanoyl-CoA hydroxylase
MQIGAIKTAVASLKKNGYAVIPKFISASKCEEAIAEINRLIDGFQPTKDQLTIFDASTGKNDHQMSKYFLESADKVSFFYEAKAWKDGKLTVPQREGINKIGHSLHEHNPIF